MPDWRKLEENIMVVVGVLAIFVFVFLFYEGIVSLWNLY